MSKAFAFYNPLAGNGDCKTDVHLLDLIYDEPIVYCDLTKPETYERHLFSVDPEDLLVLCGGDGTLNRFFNLLPLDMLPCDVLCFPLGRRNEFAAACAHPFGSEPFSVRQVLPHLPRLKINERVVHFLSTIRWSGHISVPATLTVDGVCHSFRRVRELTVRVLPKSKELSVYVRARGEHFAPLRKTLSLSGREICVSFTKTVTPYIDGDPFVPTSRLSASI